MLIIWIKVIVIELLFEFNPSLKYSKSVQIFRRNRVIIKRQLDKSVGRDLLVARLQK